MKARQREEKKKGVKDGNVEKRIQKEKKREWGKEASGSEEEAGTK